MQGGYERNGKSSLGRMKSSVQGKRGEERRLGIKNLIAFNLTLLEKWVTKNKTHFVV